MRWALVKVCVAVTSMVVIAFAVPLGLVIKELARDRAFSNAEREAAAVAPALSITTDRSSWSGSSPQRARTTGWPCTYRRATASRPSCDGSPSRPAVTCGDIQGCAPD